MVVARGIAAKAIGWLRVHSKKVVLWAVPILVAGGLTAVAFSDSPPWWWPFDAEDNASTAPVPTPTASSEPRPTPEPSPKFPGEWRIGFGTLGPLKIGMSGKDLVAKGVADYRDEVTCGDHYDSDFYDVTGDQLDLHFGLSRDLRRLDAKSNRDSLDLIVVKSPGVRTAEKIQVGSTVGALRRAYYGALITLQGEDSNHEFAVVSRDGAIRLVIENRRTVREFDTVSVIGITGQQGADELRRHPDLFLGC